MEKLYERFEGWYGDYPPTCDVKLSFSRDWAGLGRNDDYPGCAPLYEACARATVHAPFYYCVWYARSNGYTRAGQVVMTRNAGFLYQNLTGNTSVTRTLRALQAVLPECKFRLYGKALVYTQANGHEFSFEQYLYVGADGNVISHDGQVDPKNRQKIVTKAVAAYVKAAMDVFPESAPDSRTILEWCGWWPQAQDAVLWAELKQPKYLHVWGYARVSFGDLPPEVEWLRGRLCELPPARRREAWTPEVRALFAGRLLDNLQERLGDKFEL